MSGVILHSFLLRSLGAKRPVQSTTLRLHTERARVRHERKQERCVSSFRPRRRGLAPVVEGQLGGITCATLPGHRLVLSSKDTTFVRDFSFLAF